jgi:phosphopantothenoylcysteine decarboxylase/phosphopantothenate--cysteine ligase
MTGSPERIRETLAGKKIVLGVTGSIAAFKAAQVARLMVKAEADVWVVLTEAGSQFVSSQTFAALTKRDVSTELFVEPPPPIPPHLSCAEGAAAIVIAPASADFLARAAGGFGSDLLSCVCLAATCPRIVAPGMHHQMWANPIVQANRERLLSFGYTFVGPISGELAGRDVGLGRMAEPETIVAAVVNRLAEDLVVA